MVLIFMRAKYRNIIVKAKPLVRVKLRRLINIMNWYMRCFYVEKTFMLYICMNKQKARRITGPYITPSSYTEIESCICLGCTYSCTYTSFKNFVSVDIRLKSIRNLLRLKGGFGQI